MSRTDGGTVTESFSVYGFKLAIPNTWRVEFNPKGSRDKGDVVFHSPGRNRVFVSWGPVAEVQQRFRTLEEHRDWSVANLKKSRSVRSVSISESTVGSICGHRALTTRLSAASNGGFMAKKHLTNEVNSVHFICPNSSRYYIIYSTLGSPEEYPDFQNLFDELSSSMCCHDQIGSQYRPGAPSSFIEEGAELGPAG